MDAFITHFFGTLGILSACGVVAAMFAAAEFMRDCMARGFSHTVWTNYVDPNWQYSETATTRKESGDVE